MVLILKDNFALVFLYIFVGISILWSDYTFVSFKRWFRLIEVIPIAMVVLSEESPLDALESVFRRCAYVLVPFSLILAKYYPHLGASYSRWSGMLVLDRRHINKKCSCSPLLGLVYFHHLGVSQG